MQELIHAVLKMIERDNVSFNLMMELDVKYQLNLAEILQKGIKKETACAGTHTVSKNKNLSYKLYQV